MKRMLIVAAALVFAAGCGNRPAAPTPAPAPELPVVATTEPGLGMPPKAEPAVPEVTDTAPAGGASGEADRGNEASPPAAKPSAPSAATPQQQQTQAPAVTPPKAPAAATPSAPASPAPALQEPAIATAPPAAAKPEDSGGKAAPMPTDLIAPPKLESSGTASQSSADATLSAQSLFESTCAVCQGGKLEGGKPPRP